jgi:hypothetical protein
MLALAPREPVDPVVLGVPEKVTWAPFVAVIVTVSEPAAVSSAALRSTNVNATVLGEVVPGANVPAEVAATDANADGATAVARREARSAALVAALIAFFIRFK